MYVRNRGFTLIELLVVISIIGLISSVIITSIDTARIKGRDTQRIAQLNQFMRALEVYYSVHGTYPYGATAGAIQVQHLTTSVNVGQALVSAGAIPSIPADPVYPSSALNADCNLPGYGYCYCSPGGNSYVLTINTEDDKGSTDRCFVRHGPDASTFCQGHHGDPTDIAGQDCNDRF
jgi:prepilin-type N-terminal cleavage/methylation domain-containing protein